MKKSVKRLAACAAALGLVFGETGLPEAGAGIFVDISASAATTNKNSGTCGYGLSWTLDDLGTLTITDDGTSNGSMHDYFYTSESPFYGDSRIKNVIIGDGVSTIGYSAFESCPNLEKVTFPDSLHIIGPEAFKDCTNLAEINTPDSVLYIERDAFENTAWLKTKQEADPLVIFGHILLNGQTAAGDVVVPEGITAIGEYAFKNCEELTSVVLPDGVTDVQMSAFYNCKNLKSINFPDGLVSIDDSAFSHCESLTSADLPESLTTLSPYSFLYCTALEDITIPEGVREIEASTFKGTAWIKAQKEKSPFIVINGILVDASGASGEVTVPDGVTRIGGLSFSDGAEVTKVVIPEGVTVIDAEAFSGCRTLESVSIPNSVRKIGEDAFLGCAMKEVTIPPSVTEIDSHAFGFSERHYFGYESIYDRIRGFTIHCCSLSAGAEYAEKHNFNIDYAEEIFALSLKASTDQVKPGETFTVTLNIDENTGINGFAANIGFDNSAFELIGGEIDDEIKVRTGSLYDMNKSGLIPLTWSDEKIKAEHGYSGYYGYIDIYNYYDELNSINAFDYRAFYDYFGFKCFYRNKGNVLTLKLRAKTDVSAGSYNFTLTGCKAAKTDFNGYGNTVRVPVKASGCSMKIDSASDLPYPVVSVESNGRQFRFKWNPVNYAEKYAVAVYIAGKWKIQTQSIPASTLSYTSPKNLTPGKTYKVAIAAKVNCEWTVADAIKHAVTVTVK
ncbi:leucine-rich repeat protein [Ruminococcus albus]|uniref:Cohesin domain-containing protein n=1 Tax=Ruminococcus albus TaxID=1264 RepID=A0A1H7QDL3_RUMAL|nr:leucine-rich repeat protein [Ruminococcus albus]SEL45724.1 Cohesin domain-containing protein [Ruminococcus albus]